MFEDMSIPVLSGCEELTVFSGCLYYHPAHLAIINRSMLKYGMAVKIGLEMIDMPEVLWQPLVTKLIEAQAINLKGRYCCGDHKRTRQRSLC